MHIKNNKIFVDGDGCPVTSEILSSATAYDINVVFVSSYAHSRKKAFPPNVKEVVTDPDREAVDMVISNQVAPGDIVVTQDLGLAGLLLAKQVTVLTPRGTRVSDLEIDFLLDRRHADAKRRRAGKKTKGPKKMLKEDREFFQVELEKILSDRQEI
ncbi:DUF188 domain-containing protein [Salipaludibacillus aurantiacus]|uniref:UPF0178 protein SAMN05518684_10374 n=1 Tax=Salipaludibacillus aurantiacus TaxID=1601833 RepID=A0A1H9RBS4_9BACI|nr:DUF188 domain-containing protein [Salipaludibacillus aurantiacus]SER70108.1 hypothetical protein SAMN05518684_10374 [Salipaludibacillus aurantiacus]